MKTFRTILLVLVCASLIFITSGFAGKRSTDNRFVQAKLELIEKNLVLALNSGMPTLQASAAIVLKQVKFYTPEYDFPNAIIPLMRIVKDENNEVTTRIAAAVVLHDLRSGRGDYAIKTTAQFTDVERIKRICTLLAYDRMKQSQTDTQ